MYQVYKVLKAASFRKYLAGEAVQITRNKKPETRTERAESFKAWRGKRARRTK